MIVPEMHEISQASDWQLINMAFHFGLLINDFNLPNVYPVETDYEALREQLIKDVENSPRYGDEP